mgnify:CR=1 FL=1
MKAPIVVSALLGAFAVAATVAYSLPAQRTVAKAAVGFENGADPFLWLEDKDGAQAMTWVRQQNAKSLPVLEDNSHYDKLYAEALKIAQSKDRIAFPRSCADRFTTFGKTRTTYAGFGDAHRCKAIAPHRLRGPRCSISTRLQQTKKPIGFGKDRNARSRRKSVASLRSPTAAKMPLCWARISDLP